MGVGQSNQPFSAPRPRSIPTWGSNQNPNSVMAAWQSQITSNIRNASPQTPPRNFTVTNGLGGLTLNWGQVAGADGYEILKSNNGSFKTDLQVIPIQHNSQTSYFDAISGTSNYRIRATSGTPQTPQSARGPESGPIAHTVIATGTTTTPTTIRDMSTTDKSSAGARLGNYGNFKTPGGPSQSATAVSAGGTSGSASNPGTGGAAYDPAGAAAAALAAAEAYTDSQLAGYIPEAVITTVGNIIVGSAVATATSLAPGTTNEILTMVGGLPAWSTTASVSSLISTTATIGTLVSPAATITTLTAATATIGILAVTSTVFDSLHSGGVAGQVYTVSTTGLPQWEPSSSGFSNPMTTAGDMIYESAALAATRLPIGINTQVMTVVGGLPAWATAGASSLLLSVLTTNASYKPLSTDQLVLFNASVAVTATLNSALSKGTNFIIKNTSTQSNVYVVTTSGLIDWQTSIGLLPLDSIDVDLDGTNWWIT